METKPIDRAKLSVITPSLNQGEFLERNILSILNQTYDNIEHIVIDGGSTDNTVDILKRYEGSVKWISEPDKGQSDAVNKGFLMATGNIFSWLNSDDTYPSNGVETVVHYFNERPDVIFIYGENDSIDEDDNIIDKHVPSDFSVSELVNQACTIHQPSTFFRRSVIQDVGLLDLGLEYALDLDFFIRVGLHYSENQLLKVPETLAYFRRHPGQKTGYCASFMNTLACEIETLRLSRKYGGSIFNKRHRLFLKRLAVTMLKSATNKIRG